MEPTPRQNRFVYHKKCPYPGCPHVFDILTKVHCRTAHNMEREDLIKKYGHPEPIPMGKKFPEKGGQ